MKNNLNLQTEQAHCASEEADQEYNNQKQCTTKQKGHLRGKKIRLWRKMEIILE